MSEKIIDDIIQMAEQQETSAHGGNKQCYLIDDYALLRQKFLVKEIDEIIQIGERLESKGVKVARTLDYKILSQGTRNWNSDNNALVADGYVLQQRAIGKPLLDRTNWDEEGKKYQLDYLRQIDSISQEGQEFFSNFVKGWLEIQNTGIGIDPSKSGNFIYEQGKGITFIDLELSNRKTDLSTTIFEQLAVILNLSTYHKCYPEVKEAVDKRFGNIIDKYRNAIIEQGIDIDVLNQVLETNFIPQRKSEESKLEKESPENEIIRLENTIADHVKSEETAREETRKLQAERAEKARAEREAKEAERKRLEETKERQNEGKRNDSKMYAILYGLLNKGIIPEEQANILRQVFQTKRNIYADLNPELFGKHNTKIDLKSIIPNVESNNIAVDIRNMELIDNGNIPNQTYEQIKMIVYDYFKQYFGEISQNAEAKISEYSKMKEMHKNGQLTEEQIVHFSLLGAELKEFSNAKQIFPILGMDEQDKTRVAEEDLVSFSDNMSPTQIGKAVARKGIGINEINQTTREIRRSFEQDRDIDNELSNE